MSKLISNDTISSIYNDYHPAFKNLYTVQIMSSSTNDVIKKSDNIVNNYIQYHATNISFNGESLSLSRNKVTRQFQINSSNSFSYSDELTITWREADDWRVKRFHEDWIGLFYDKNKDQYRSFPWTTLYNVDGINKSVTYTKDNIYKTIKIILPKPVSSDSGYSKNVIVFKGVLPSNSGNIDLGWSTQSDVVSHQMKYYVTEWYWDYDDSVSESLNPGEGNGNGEEDKKFGDYLKEGLSQIGDDISEDAVKLYDNISTKFNNLKSSISSKFKK